MATRVRARTRPLLHMIGNAHLDVVWLWQAWEGLQEVKATFRSALDRMHEHPDFKFAASSAAYYEWIEENEPAMFEEIRERVAEGRWEPVGGWWVEPDCNLPGGEALARQALYGQRYFRSRFGRTASVGYNVDSFGHPGTLPQLLRRARLERYVMMRPMPNEMGLPARLFWWEADDGSRVLTYRIPFEYCTPGGDITAHVERCAAEARPPLDELMCFYGVGNHGGGPTRRNLETIEALAGSAERPADLVFSTPREFFERAEAAERWLPTVHTELQHHAVGCYSAHSGLKAANRRAEQLLLAAEKLAAVAQRVTGLAYPVAELTRAWKSVLFNQFHDILAGTSIEPACEDALHAYGEAAAVAGRALNQALQSLAWRIDIEHVEGTVPVVAFNPHSWPVRANLELESNGLGGATHLVDEAGGQLPVQHVTSWATVGGGRRRISFLADLPAGGYRVFRTRPGGGEPAPPAAGSGHEAETSRWRLAIDPATGHLGSLFDKREGCEVLAGPGGRAVVLRDETDTWAHGVFAFTDQVGEFEVTRVSRVESGPVKTVLRVESRFGGSTLTQDYILCEGRDVIEVRATVDWRERHRMLKLRWPVDVNFRRATSEVPFGRVERPEDGAEQPGQTWVDVSGIHRSTNRPYGLSVLNDSKYSYDVAGRSIGLTVLRSPVYAHHDPHVPESWDGLSFQDQGRQRFGYALLPHAGGWEEAGTARHAAELNQPPVAIIDTGHRGTLPLSGSFFAVDPPSVVVSGLKGAEAGGGAAVLRLVETAGVATRARVDLGAWGRTFDVDLGPFEVRTYRVPAAAAEPIVETDLLELTPDE